MFNEQLMALVNDGLSRPWSIPTVTTPLSEAEKEKLRSLTLSDLIVPTTFGGMSPTQSFIVQVLTGIASQYTSHFFTKPLVTQLASPTHHSSRPLPKEVPTHVISEQSSSSPSTSSSTGTDPFTESMKSTATSKATSVVTGAIEHELRLGLTASHAGEQFTNTVTAAFKRGVNTALFATKVAEQGWDTAIVDTARDVLIDLAAKTSVDTMLRVVATAHPAGLSVAFTTIVAEMFSVTETAPSHMDRRPLPPPPIDLSEALRNLPPPSNIPTLHPLYPTWTTPN